MTIIVWTGVASCFFLSAGLIASRLQVARPVAMAVASAHTVLRRR
jgi:hypothetical protein